MSMPSLDIFKSTPATEVLRVESEPPGVRHGAAESQAIDEVNRSSGSNRGDPTGPGGGP